uniref:Uncharacterized protein n=2 Tax=Plectus sambesii TaxID=2011161 RepID=A0A914VVF4_9BILA
MANLRMSNILQSKENVDENEMSQLANKTRALNVFSEPPTDLKSRKGLTLNGKDNNMQTPRRALGDVKNIQQSSHMSTSKSTRMLSDATKPESTQLLKDSEEEEELPIDTCSWQDPEEDDFADILGPMHDRLSSLTSRQWNQVIPDTNKLFSSLLGVAEDDVEALLDDAERDVDRIGRNGGDLCADDIAIL